MFEHNINDSERQHSSMLFGILPERKTLNAIKTRFTMGMSSGQALSHNITARFSNDESYDGNHKTEVKPSRASLITGSTEPHTPSQKNGPPDQQ